MSKLIAAALLAGAVALPAAVQAQDAFVPKRKGQLIVNLRATDVAPDNGDNPILTAAGAATGLQTRVSDDVMPTLGFTWFLTDNVAVEAIAGTTRHRIRAVGPGTDVLVHKEWVLPPVVSLQYHPLPAARVSPYVGAGVNYMLFYSGRDYNGFTVDLDSKLGVALQGGVDVAVSGPWVVNADAKKVFFHTDAVINGGTLGSRVKLDPWVLSLGVGRKF